MAAASSLSEDFLTCAICMELYNQPKTLACLHTFCLPCLEQLVAKQAATMMAGQLLCPTCRNPTKLPPGGPSGLPSNFYVANLKEALANKEAKEQEECTMCALVKLPSQPASAKCLQCGDYLCEKCKIGHCLSRATIDHVIVSMAELKSGKYDHQLRQTQKVFCPKHQQKKVKYFCTVCRTPLCTDCKILDHEGHQCQTLQQACDAVSQEMVTVTDKLKSQIANNDEQCVLLAAKVQSLQLEKDKITQEIKHKLDSVIAEARTNHDKLIQDLSKAFDVKFKSVRNAQSNMAQDRRTCEAKLQTLQGVLDYGRPTDIIQFQDQLSVAGTDNTQKGVPTTDEAVVTFKPSRDTIKLGTVHGVSTGK